MPALAGEPSAIHDSANCMSLVRERWNEITEAALSTIGTSTTAPLNESRPVG
jgi:hypothetical protein